MAGISPINNSSISKPSPPSGSLDVSQNQFIKLFVAQLNSQDPLAPMDTNQMLTQLSQISSVESLNSIDDRVSGLTSSLEQSQLLGAAQLMGKDVQISTNRVALQQAGEIQGIAQLSVSASELLVRVYDSKGVMVDSKSLGMQSAGAVKFTTNSLDPGAYTITATALNGDKAYAAGIGLKGTVTGIETANNGTYLQLKGIGSFPLSSVTAIGQ